MYSLPWLLIHGQVVWPVSLAAIVTLALVVAILRPRRAAQKAAKAARDKLGEPQAALQKPSDGMRVTLTGTIEVQGDPAKRFEDGGDAAAASAAYELVKRGDAWITGLNVRAEKLSLRVGDTTVTLEGPVEVVAGSREVQRGEELGQMPKAVQDRVALGFKLGAPHFRDHVTRLRSVAPGDAVRVSGVLRRDASAGEGSGYRAASDRWKLVPDGEEEQAAAGGAAPRGLRVAFEGAARVEGPRAPWHLKHVGAGALIGVVTLSLFGEIALAWADSARTDPAAAASALTATSLAATSPWRREAAIRRLADALDLRHEEDAAQIHERAALHELGKDCDAAALALARHGFFDEGGAVAARCGDHALAAKIFYAAGDFAKASAERERVEPNRVKPGTPAFSDADYRFAVRVHVLAGHPALAAHEARNFSKSLEERAKAQPGDKSRAGLARCLADALDAKAGDKAARARLEKEREKPIYPACAILLADLYQGKERVDLIHGITSFQSSAREAPMRWLELLEQEADPFAVPSASRPTVVDEPSLFVINPALAIEGMLPAVERAIAEAKPPEKAKPAEKKDPEGAGDSLGLDPQDETRRVTRVRSATLAAAFAAATGDYEGARRLAKSLGDDDTAQHAAVVASAVELSAGGIARATELLALAKKPYASRGAYMLDALVRYRGERDVKKLGYFYASWHIREEGVDRAMSMAADGDGPALAAWLRRPSSDPGAFFRLGAPLISSGQQDLIRWIRLGYRMPGWFRSTAAEAVYDTDLAGAATALGDDALAVSLRERASRFRSALLRRDLAVPLAVLERL